MGELLGITGAIGSGKTAVAEYFADMVPNHAVYETWFVIAEIASAFNKALEAELAYETTQNPIELANQVLIWLPDAISEQLHHDVVWNQLAFTKHDTLTHPELYEKLLTYLQQIESNRSLLKKELTPETKETFRALLQWLGSYLVVRLSKTIWYDELMRRIDLHDSRADLVIVSGVRYPSDAEVVRAHGGIIISVERPDLAPTKHDLTEVERSAIRPDITLQNNGTLDQLQKVIETAWNDIAAGNPKKHYSATV